MSQRKKEQHFEYYMDRRIDECVRTGRGAQALWLRVILEAWSDAHCKRPGDHSSTGRSFLTSAFGDMAKYRELACDLADIDEDWLQRQCSFNKPRFSIVPD